MIQAPVGHHCPACVQEGNKGVRRVQAPGTAGLVVKALVAVNVLVFLLQQGDPSVLPRFADNPLLVANGEYYRMLTAAFLHANLLHILFNMMGLFIFGSQVEAALGRVRFLALYLVAAFGGSLCSLYFSPARTYGVGASGAVFGLFGAYFVIARSRKVDTSQVVGLIVVNLVFGAIYPGIDNYAHIGGLLAGGALAMAYTSAGSLRGTARLAAQAAAVVAIVVAMVVLMAVRTSQLSSGLL
jgi:membrane associated rhomboid family serine protease